MSYSTEGHAGSAFERRTTIPEFQTGLRARSTDSQDWIYVRASGAVGAGVCKVEQSGSTWIVTSAAGTFTNPASFADGQYGWVRQTYFLPDEAVEVKYDDTVTGSGQSQLQGVIEYIFANFSPTSHTHSLNDLSDVTISGVVTGQFLRYSGSQWVNVAITELLALNDLSDVSTSGQISGSIIRYNGASWVIAADNAHTHTLSQITDAGTLAGLNSVGTGQISNDAVTFAKIQNLGQGTLIGRFTASTGDPEAVTISSGLTLDGSGNLTANVRTVFGRTGAIVSAASDYDASQIDNDSGVTGAFVDDALDWLNANKAALSHTHTASAITDFAEAVDDRVAALCVAGTGMIITYNDGAGTLTFESTGGSGVADGDKGDITVSSSGTVWTIDNNVVTYAKMQDVSATSRVLGRITAGAGDVEELTAANLKTILGALTVPDGGTGVSSLTAYAPVFGGTTSTGAVQSGTVGTAGQVLTSNGAGALPTFQDTSGGGSWTLVNKASDTSRSSTTTETADPDLQFSLAASTNYAIRILVKLRSPAAADFKWGLTGPASPTEVYGAEVGVAIGANSTFEAYPTGAPKLGGTDGAAVLLVELTVENGANAGTLSFNWAQNTSNAGATLVKAGSYIEYRTY